MRRPWAIAAMAVAGVVMATGWASSIASSSPPPPAPDWVMIQGRVSQRSVQWATVITPPWRPYCAPGTLCPMVIIAGRVYRVRLVGSVDETAAGMPSARPMRVGENVVVVVIPMFTKRSSGTSISPIFRLQAKVWEALQSMTPYPVPGRLSLAPR